MESNVLRSLIDVESFDPGYLFIAVIGLSVLVIILIVLYVSNLLKVKKLSGRLDRLCMGSDAESLEEEIGKIIEDNQYLKSTTEQHKGNIKTLYKRMAMACQKTALVKYDALDQMGGQLSFVIVMLDEKDNGFILNSVHTSATNYIYSKEVRSGECDVELGIEEEMALEKAKSVKIPK